MNMTMMMMMMMITMITMKRFKQKVVHKRSDNYAIHRVESASSYLIAAPKGRISHFFTSTVFVKPNYSETSRYLPILLFVPRSTQ